MDKICICLLTYNRFEYAETTLRNTLDNIKYPDPVSVHIADDGSPGDYRQRLVDIAGGYPNVQGVTVSNSERGGYGRNVNLATQVIHLHAHCVLMLEDDWKLIRPLDLEPLVNALNADVGIDCIRLGYLSFTQAMRGELLNIAPEWNKYLLFDPKSEEPHVFAGHPRLETVAYQRRVGEWQEGLEPGMTEFVITHRPEARMGVAWPLDLVHPRGDLFAHIGAIRSTEVDTVTMDARVTEAVSAG